MILENFKIKIIKFEVSIEKKRLVTSFSHRLEREIRVLQQF
jgi:hypothetical protein